MINKEHKYTLEEFSNAISTSKKKARKCLLTFGFILIGLGILSVITGFKKPLYFGTGAFVILLGLVMMVLYLYLTPKMITKSTLKRTPELKDGVTHKITIDDQKSIMATFNDSYNKVTEYNNNEVFVSISEKYITFRTKALSEIILPKECFNDEEIEKIMKTYQNKVIFEM